MEFITLALFCALLLLCVIFNFSILYALVGGLVLFLLYGKRKGFTCRDLALMAISGIKTVKNVLITFLLIGMLTALWREASTIPVIVCYAAKLIRPSLFLVMAFLLNCLVSFMTGTAFGTAATMGVICTTIASTMQMNPVFVGGAVLSGVYFGDRCSPVSTSALLVSELTKTNIFQNIKSMFRSAAAPFLVTCMLYLTVGFLTGGSGEILDLQALFGREFVLSPSALLPGVVPLASVGAPTSSILFACFLYFLPLWRVVVDVFHMHKTLRNENRLLKEKLNDIYRAAFGLDHGIKE